MKMIIEKYFNTLYVEDFDGNPPEPEKRWFCIENKHYEDWRTENKKGGDMLLLSDAVLVSLENYFGAIKFELTENSSKFINLFRHL